jgi:hypothetical protein
MNHAHGERRVQSLAARPVGPYRQPHAHCREIETFLARPGAPMPGRKPTPRYSARCAATRQATNRAGAPRGHVHGFITGGPERASPGSREGRHNRMAARRSVCTAWALNRTGPCDCSRALRRMGAMARRHGTASSQRRAGSTQPVRRAGDVGANLARNRSARLLAGW